MMPEADAHSAIVALILFHWRVDQDETNLADQEPNRDGQKSEE